MRRGAGSMAVTRNTSQVTAGARTAEASTPSVASSSSGPVNASDATSSETVNATPAIVPPPATPAHPTGGRSRPRVAHVTSADVPTMPTGLPTT